MVRLLGACLFRGACALWSACLLAVCLCAYVMCCVLTSHALRCVLAGIWYLACAYISLFPAVESSVSCSVRLMILFCVGDMGRWAVG
jgi:hypothetical protein